MIKDKLHTISDEDAIEVAKILLKTSSSDLYNFEFCDIDRRKYDIRDGIDAEESIEVKFMALVKNEAYKKAGWTDKKVTIQIIEKDNYHDHPYFNGFAKPLNVPDPNFRHEYISNHIEAVEYLQSKNLI